MSTRARKISMHPRARRLALGLVLSSALLASGRADESAASGEAPGGGAFRRDALLGRFDRDRDGRLDAGEREALREAFGGIDVPILPSLPFDYSGTDRARAAMSERELRQIDSTPADNPLTDAGATLGRVLFYDRQLSRNNTVSCASCHEQKHGFADPRKFSVGFEGGLTGRNAMALANLRYTRLRGLDPGFFWDERAPTLEAQTLMPIQDEIEMGMGLGELEERLRGLPYYPGLFRAAFGSPEITSRRVARALAQFLRSLVSFDSRFDRAARRHGRLDDRRDFDGFTAQENLGKSLFIDGIREVPEFGCAFCHIPPTFGMPKSFNNGLDAKYRDPGLGALGRPSNDPLTPSNDGKFKAPSLRNVELGAPYMHDGRFATLEEVVEHYSEGVHPHENVSLAFEDQETVVLGSGRTSGFKFSAEQKAALVAFLKTLTDESFVSDPRFSDPFVRLDEEGANGTPAPAEQFRALVEAYEKEGDPGKYAKRFLQLAETYPRDAVALEALVWVLKKRRTRPEAGRALELLGRTQLRNEGVAAACPAVARVPSRASESLLRDILAKNPQRGARAQACWHLAELLKKQAEVVDELKRDPGLAPRILQYYGKDYGGYLSSLDPGELSGKREKVYETMRDSFAGESVDDTTMGEVAVDELYRIRQLSIGRKAPDIEGEDIHGKTFRLSEYRGKVVVLSFWAHW